MVTSSFLSLSSIFPWTVLFTLLHSFVTVSSSMISITLPATSIFDIFLFSFGFFSPSHFLFSFHCSLSLYPSHHFLSYILQSYPSFSYAFYLLLWLHLPSYPSLAHFFPFPPC